MAKSLNRGLGALAALGALSYHLSRGSGTNRAPVEDRDVSGRPKETFMGFDDTGAAASGDDIARFADVGTNLSESGQPYSLTATPGPAASAARAAPSSRATAPADAVDAAAMFRASERAERGTPAMRNPNISAEVARRTGVRLDSRAGAGRGGQGGPTAAELEAYARQQRSARTAPRQMTREEMIAQIPTGGYPDVSGGERVSGNEFTRNVGNILNAPVPGVIPIGRAAGAAGRAGSTSRELGYLAETPVTFLGRSGSRPVRGSERIEGGASQALLTEGQRALPSTKALPAPQGRIAGPSRADLTARDRAAREAARRDEMLRENAEAYGLNPNAPGYEAAMRALRKDLGGSDFTLKKKGGMIRAKAKSKKMASGGMSSASKRADGIASKGKTKCKMY